MAQENKNLTGNTSADAPRSTPGGATGQGAPGQSIPAASGSQSGTGAATARGLVDQAKQTAGQAYGAMTDKAADKIDEQKATLADGLSSVADSIRQASQNLGGPQADNQIAQYAGKYTQTAAEKVEQIARYFDTHDTRAMVRDVESFARRNPAVFIGAAFGLGILAARFLKSSPRNYDTGNASPGFDMQNRGALSGATTGQSTTLGSSGAPIGGTPVPDSGTSSL